MHESTANLPLFKLSRNKDLSTDLLDQMYRLESLKFGLVRANINITWTGLKICSLIR